MSDFNLLFGITISLWTVTGALVCFCAQEFLEIRATLVGLLLAMVLGPFAINRGLWIKRG